MRLAPAIVLLGSLALLTPSCVIELGDFNGPRVQKDVELSYTSSAPVREFYVDAYNGNVSITEGTGSTITGTSRVKAQGRNDEQAKERLDSMIWNFSEEANGRVVLRLSKPVHGGTNNCGATADLQVPAGVRILVDTSNGGVTITGNFPYAFVDSSNGAVSLNGVKEVEVDTGNGPVRVMGADGKVIVDTSNGPVVLIGNSEDFHLDTSNGPVTIELSKDWSGKGTADSSNGSISLKCLGRMDCKLSASTSNGKVRVDGPALDSGRGSLTLETSNGSITVEHVGGN